LLQQNFLLSNIPVNSYLGINERHRRPDPGIIKIIGQELLRAVANGGEVITPRQLIKGFIDRI
jgi:hypothetical protein